MKGNVDTLYVSDRWGLAVTLLLTDPRQSSAQISRAWDTRATSVNAPTDKATLSPYCLQQGGAAVPLMRGQRACVKSARGYSCPSWYRRANMWIENEWAAALINIWVSWVTEWASNSGWFSGRISVWVVGLKNEQVRRVNDWTVSVEWLVHESAQQGSRVAEIVLELAR